MSRGSYDAFGLIGAALSKNSSVFQSSSLTVVPISPNAAQVKLDGRMLTKLVSDHYEDADAVWRLLDRG